MSLWLLLSLFKSELKRGSLQFQSLTKTLLTLVVWFAWPSGGSCPRRRSARGRAPTQADPVWGFWRRSSTKDGSEPRVCEWEWNSFHNHPHPEPPEHKRHAHSKIRERWTRKIKLQYYRMLFQYLAAYGFTQHNNRLSEKYVALPAHI